MLLLLGCIVYVSPILAEPWDTNSSKIEVRNDNKHGQHLYITFTEGPVTMMRASLPNNWKVIEAKIHNPGLLLKVEGRPNLCYDTKSFGRVYSEVMTLNNEQESKKALVWEKYAFTCE